MRRDGTDVERCVDCLDGGDDERSCCAENPVKGTAATCTEGDEVFADFIAGELVVDSLIKPRLSLDGCCRFQKPGGAKRYG